MHLMEFIFLNSSDSHVADFKIHNKLLTQKILKEGYRYHRHCSIFSRFNCGYYYLKFKFHVGLNSHLRQRLSDLELYGDLVYKITKIVGTDNFPPSL